MMSNHTYNLMHQLVVEHKSLWRIRNEYMRDKGDCSMCSNLLGRLAKEKEKNISEIKKILKEHMSEKEGQQ